MTTVIEYECSECGFLAGCAVGGLSYISTPNRKKIFYVHLGRFDEVLRFIKREFGELGKEEISKVLAEYSGTHFRYICRKCFEFSDLDEKRDDLKCTACGSTDLILMKDLPFTSCPRCQSGRFGQGTTKTIY